MCNTIINAIAVKTTLSRLTNALFYYSTRSTEPVIKNLFLLTVKRFPTVRSHHVRLECKGLVTNKCEWKDNSFTWKRCWWKSVTSSSNQTVQALNACYHSTWNVVESNSRRWNNSEYYFFTASCQVYIPSSNPWHKSVSYPWIIVGAAFTNLNARKSVPGVTYG